MHWGCTHNFTVLDHHTHIHGSRMSLAPFTHLHAKHVSGSLSLSRPIPLSTSQPSLLSVFLFTFSPPQRRAPRRTWKTCATPLAAGARTPTTSSTSPLMKKQRCMWKDWTHSRLSKVLEDTPAVLSLGKLCDENGYSYEWINGQKTHHIKNGIRIPATRRTSFLLRFQTCQVRSLDLHQLSHSPSSSPSSPSSPTVGEIQVREREDAPNSDISPVPVSKLVDDSSGRDLTKTKPTKSQKKIKRKPR